MPLPSIPIIKNKFISDISCLGNTMKKKLAVLLAAVMCFSAAPQSTHFHAAESEDSIMPLSCSAHGQFSAIRVDDKIRISDTHQGENNKPCNVTGYTVIYVTYCRLCGGTLHTRTQDEEIKHSVCGNI